MTNPGNGTNNNTYPEWENRTYSETELLADNVQITLTSFIVMICLLILVISGIVFCDHVLKARSNEITVYILNLAVANFIFIIGSLIYMGDFVWYFVDVDVSEPIRQIYLFADILLDIGFSVSSFLLATISVERCLSVFFPFWHQSHQSQRLSACICLFLWLLCLLVIGLEMFCNLNDTYQKPISEQCTALYCSTSSLYVVVMFIMVFSTIILLLESQEISKQWHPPRLHVVIVITILIVVLDFLIFRVAGFFKYFSVFSCNVYTWYSYYITAISTSIYCSANPYIVIFVGRSWKQCGKPFTSKDQFTDKTTSRGSILTTHPDITVGGE